MRIKGKRRLKNGVLAGYVKQEDGSWRFRFIGGGKKKNKKNKKSKKKSNKKKYKKQKGGAPCCPGDTKIVKAHGTLFKQFILPVGSSFITLTNTGDPCPYYSRLDDEIMRFFKNGHKLFLPNSTIKTKEGENFQDYLNMFKPIFNFKNHIGDGKTLFNDMLLNFEEDCTDDSCTISCVNGPIKCKPVTNESGMILLSQLIKQQGNGKYVIIACRDVFSRSSLPEKIRELGDLKLYRNTSNRYERRMKKLSRKARKAKKEVAAAPPKISNLKKLNLNNKKNIVNNNPLTSRLEFL